MRVAHNKTSFEKVKADFEKKGFILLETEYREQYSKMRFICPKHPNEITETTYKNLKTRNGCVYCSRRKINIHEIKKEFKERGYKLISDSYENNRTPLKYTCPEHGIKLISYDTFSRGSGCRECYSKTRRGEGSPTWKGGVNDLNDSLRKLIKPLMRMKLEESGYVCQITKEKGVHLEVHHITPFHVLRDAALEELGIKNKKKSEMSSKEIDELYNLFFHYHQETELVVLKKDLHEKFHNVYGDDVGRREFDMFVSSLKGGEISCETKT